jgi:site-specific DNA-methyltransferase (adenine-specific)
MTPYYTDDLVTLYHGDCLELDNWLAADLLVTDPPYGVAYRDRLGRHQPILGDHDTTARDSAIAAWGSDRPTLVFGSWRTKKPSGVRNVLIWDKGTDLGMGASTPWGLSHEEIYVLGQWPVLIPGGRVREGGTPSRVSSVLRVNKPNNAAANRVIEHPTPKPVPLLERLLERCPFGRVADPFAGSGTTLIAARNLGRKSIGVEIDERYCELIAKRLSQGVLDFGEASA